MTRLRHLVVAAAAVVAAVVLPASAASAAPTSAPKATCKPGQTSGCTAVGGVSAAAPSATFEVTCGSGIDAVLSNVNGASAVTFRVTTPAGAVSTVTVAAQHVARRHYPVARGVRTPLTVSAPGMATKSARLPASCRGAAHVLGVKVTRADPRLPFTGRPVVPTLALGLGLLLLGFGLVRVATPTAR